MKIARLKIAAAVVLAAAMVPAAAQAQWWQQHPAYLHAMADLRQAYWLVTHRGTGDPVAQGEQRHAAQAIRAAYQNLKDAAIVDDQNIDDQPPADFVVDQYGGRLHRALDLLHRAHDEVAREEDDPAARGFRTRAVRAIDVAAAQTDAAARGF